MAEFKFPKGSPEWLMFQDYYKLCQKYWLPDKSETYWRSLVEDTGEFLVKYKNISFATQLYIAFITTQEEKIR